MRAWCAAACAASVLWACSGGYSFTGGDVGAAKTLSIQRFDNNAPLVNPKLSQQFTETLQQVMVRQTPLSLVRNDGDLDFSGSTLYTNTDSVSLAIFASVGELKDKNIKLKR